MRRFAKLADKPRPLSPMTGRTVGQFWVRSNRGTPCWQEAERERWSRPDRQRAIGAGRPYTLSRRGDQLLALLVLYRFYRTEEWLGGIGGLDHATVCRRRAKRPPLREQAADPALGISWRRRMPPGANTLSPWEGRLAGWLDCADVVTDATEPPRPRPPRRPRRGSSGQKQRHPVKPPSTVHRQGKVLPGRRRSPGRVQDSRIFPREGPAGAWPPASFHFADLGYDGAYGDAPHRTRIVPFKQRRNHRTLTPCERRVTRGQRGVRIGVEPGRSRLKKSPVLAQVSRYQMAGDHHPVRNMAALANFRLATALV